MHSLRKLIASCPDVADEHASDLSVGLIAAASKGAEEVLDLLLQVGADPDQPDCYSNTPLILASERGHTHVVRKLLQANCHVNG